VTPNGDILVRSLSFHVKPGVSVTTLLLFCFTNLELQQHLLIVGPNGTTILHSSVIALLTVS
jgi:hypothetical protein